MNETLEANAPMNERRLVMNDPEFPFWTDDPQRGHVFLWNSMAYVVVGHEWTNGNLTITGRLLLTDGSDSLDSKSFSYFAKLNQKSNIRVKVVDRMYYHGEDKPYQINMIDNEQLMGLRSHDHCNSLAEDNPLRQMPYWGSPGGKNLTIIATLEWALTHLKFVQSELPCRENEQSIVRIEEAIKLQKGRQQARIKQGVLGTKTAHKADQD